MPDDLDVLPASLSMTTATFVTQVIMQVKHEKELEEVRRRRVEQQLDRTVRNTRTGAARLGGAVNASALTPFATDLVDDDDDGFHGDS